MTLGRMLQPKIAEKDLNLIVEVSPEVPVHIVGDSLRLRQVLLNLLSNATKFTATGGAIVFRVEQKSKQGDVVVLSFFVSDTGIGISQDKQELIFESFSQADGSITRRFGGTGLGLSISQKLVRLFGGELMVNSRPGIGSTFYFDVAFKLVARGEVVSNEEVAVIENKALSQRHILIAEDNIVNQKLLVRILERAGHNVSIASDGDEVVSKYMESAFDLILMDVQMPGKDGIEATAAIRAHEAESGASRVPVIAVTAEAMEGDRERYLACGMDGYISKPINREALLETIASVVAKVKGN